MKKPTFDNALFARIYNRTAKTRQFRDLMDRHRARVTALAWGDVLEIGAGGGQNFGFYDPALTKTVTAIEPNAHMLRHAEAARKAAHVPITLTAAPAESLPFADATFDVVLATLVLCSVRDQAVSLKEMARVLKPDGTLLLVEHVRSHRRIWAFIQDVITPLQAAVAGNCHPNRDTPAAVRAAGFTLSTTDWYGGGVHPIVVLIGKRRPATAPVR